LNHLIVLFITTAVRTSNAPIILPLV
jgi:hypothetical protein